MLLNSDDVEVVPMFSVDGRYQTSCGQVEAVYGFSSTADNTHETIRVLDQLVDKVLAERESTKPKKIAKPRFGLVRPRYVANSATLSSQRNRVGL